MRPVLVLLNGLPGSGKSTLARAWVERSAAGLPLALDLDVLRSMLGGWAERPIDAGLAARSMALAAIRTRLRAGGDVVVPQFLRRPAFVDELAAAAGDAGAAFLHCCLDVEPPVARGRLAARPAGGAEGALDGTLEALGDELDAFVASRPGVVRIASDDGAATALDRAIAAARSSSTG